MSTDDDIMGDSDDDIEQVRSKLYTFQDVSTDDDIMGDSDDDIEQVRKAEDVPEMNADKERRKRYADLYVAAAKGDWGKAKAILKDHPEDVVARLGLSDEGDTTLHVATAAGHTYFVKQLLSNYLKAKDLELKNDWGNTAFCLAAMSGNIELVPLMLKRNMELQTIRNESGMLPVHMAALLRHGEMVKCLYSAGANWGILNQDDLIELLLLLIDNNLYDLALSMVTQHPELAILRERNEETDLDDESGEKDDESEMKKVGIGETALHALARKPLMTFNDLDSSKLGILKRFHYRRTTNKRMHPKALQLVQLLLDLLESDQISDLVKNPFSLISVAAELGNIDFLLSLFRKHPALISKVNEDGYTIFHTAVSYRHVNIFKLIYEIPSLKDVIFALSVDGKERNNILHLAAKLPPDRNRLDVGGAGAAFQMQRELLWFKEVRKLMPASYVEAKNGKGKTARTLFSDEHRSLMKEGEEWMKRTAESCMLVSTLIATVVFAAAITVPGGVKEDTGAPNFLKKATFLIFAISDTISLVSSSCSILTFLSIFTARYAEEEFLWSLPNKLFWGVLTLFVSIIAMMVVFCATMFIIFYDGTIGPFVLAVALASIPVFMFIYQQDHILSQVFRLRPSWILRKSD